MTWTMLMRSSLQRFYETTTLSITHTHTQYTVEISLRNILYFNK